MAKSQWHGRPAENIKVSSRSKTRVIGERLLDATGMLKTGRFSVVGTVTIAGEQKTNRWAGKNLRKWR
jgi:hypothetical protein